MQFDPILLEPRRERMEAEGFWAGQSVMDYFEACVAAKPDACALTAITEADGQRRDFTWAELDDLSWRAAAGLHKLGVGKNDVVSCQLPNSWQFVILYLACSKLGVVFNPVMPIFREHELSFMLKHGEAKVFACLLYTSPSPRD